MAEITYLTLSERTLDCWHSVPIDKVEEEVVKYLWDNAFADVNETVGEITKTVLEDLDDLTEPLRLIHNVCLSWIEQAHKNVSSLVEDESSIDASNCEDSNMSGSFDSRPNTTVIRRSLQSCISDDSSINSNDVSNDVPRKSRPEGSRCELWSMLEDNNLPVKKIMALLYILLHYGNSKPVNNEKREVAFLCARIYFSLLRIPGSRVFRIFQANIFMEVLNTLKVPHENAKSKKKQGKSRKKRVEDDFEEDIDHQNNPEHDNEANVVLDRAKLLPFMKEVLVDLGLVLESYPMKSYPQLVDNIAQVLAAFTSEMEGGHHSAGSPRRYNQVMSMSQVAYQSLLAMCNLSHGAINAVCCTVMKHLLPNVLMTSAGSAQTIHKQYQTTKDDTVSFLKRVMRTVGEEALTSARIFLQHLATKSPDRAEFRSKIAQSIISLLECFPPTHFDSMIKWFHKLNRTAKVNNRVFTLELFSLMIINNNTGIIQLSSEQYKETVRAILERCSDKSASVTSKGLAILAHYFASMEQKQNSTFVVQSAIDLLDDNVVEMLHERCCDAKVHVRKSAIQVLEQIMLLDQKFFSEKNLDLLKELCRDVGLLARKQALQSLTSCLLDNPTSRNAQKYWIMGVLPMISDREASIQEKCLETIETVLLQNLSSIARGNNALQEMAFQVVESIADGEQQGFQPYLRTVIQKWAKSGKMKPNIIASIRRLIGGEYDSTAWLLLAELSSCYVINNPAFVIEYWEENKAHSSTCTTLRVLQTILNSINCVEKATQHNLYASLLENLMAFNVPPELIGISVDIVHNIDERLNKASNRRSGGSVKWFSKIMNLIETFLDFSVTQQVEKLDAAEEETFVCHLFTLGVLSQVSGIALPKKLYSLVQTIVACSSGSYRRPLSELHPSQMSSQQVNLAFITLQIKANAYTTLGKLCLQNEDFAKENIVPLVRELQLSKEEGIRNNILITMSDLCRRYPTLVDPYIGDITARLRDPSVFVRKQVLSLLVHLLQEDYIKCKGSLFYRILVAYLDDSAEVCELAEFALMQVLLARNSQTFYQHFVECIFFFNSYTDHRVYNKFAQSEEEVKLFSLSGVENEQKRAKLYKFMLTSISDENKFRLNLRICQEILAAVTDEVIPLSPTSAGIIKDALRILCSEEIKLSSMTTTQDEVEDDMLAAVARVAKKNIVSQVVKTNVIENIVPIVIALKRLFEKNNSVLLGDLMFFLRELLKDYKNEVKEILSDKQLAKEIEFDMKRFADEEEKRRRVEARLLEARVQENRPDPVCPTPERVPTEGTNVPFKLEKHGQSVSVLRPNSNHTEVDANRRATIGGPIPVLNFDKKPQVCLERILVSANRKQCNIDKGATTSNVSIESSVCEINTATIKRTVSCDEEQGLQNKQLVLSVERVTITLPDDSVRRNLSRDVAMALQTMQPVICLERLENESRLHNEVTVVQDVSFERLAISSGAVQQSNSGTGNESALQSSQPLLDPAEMDVTISEATIKRTISCDMEIATQTKQPVPLVSLERIDNNSLQTNRAGSGDEDVGL